MHFTINGRDHDLEVDPRTTLLDLCREHLGLTGSKKGCDHGQCGACTMLVGGRRINACLAMAFMHQRDAITTIEGLGSPEALHPLQEAFIRHDGYQCGYCTPGQICSAVGMLDEAAKGWPSHVSPSHASPSHALPSQVALDGGVRLDRAEIAERMSGNICRCAAYPNIVDAIREVAEAAGA